MSFTPTNSSLMRTALHEFSNLLISLVGPSGNMCLLTSSVDSLTLTSSSSRMISNISFSNPIFQFAIQCIKSQTDRYGDGGLYSGILLSKLLARMFDGSIPKSTVCSILTELGSISQSEIENSSQLQIRIDLETIEPLIAVAQSILFSKSTSKRGQTRAELALMNLQVTLLVKAFLLTEATVGNVLLRVHVGSEYQHLFKGVLYSSVDEECEVIGKTPWHSASVLLFSVMLSDQIDCKEKDLSVHELATKRDAQFQAAQLFTEKAISCGIQVIACQKVVHPMLLLKLRRKGILVLQRLGKCTAQAVEKLSGAIPISNLSSSSLESLLSLKGCLRKVQAIQHCGGNFVLLEGDCNPGVCTLLLSSSTNECSAELKVVALQALAALSQVVVDKAACPGAGCTEVYLCCFLSREVRERKKDLCKKLKCEPSQLCTVLKWFQEGLLSAAGLDFTSAKLSNDSVYHHAWRGSNDKNVVVSDDVRCNCGLLNSVDVNTAKGGWSIMTFEPSGPFTIEADNVSLTPGSELLSSHSVLDICSTKRNAIGLALDSCIAITNIGAVVTRVA